jgi:hypothetical protein
MGLLTGWVDSKRYGKFSDFYTHTFLGEHQHPLTVALHVFGTLAGLVWLFALPWLGHPLWVLLFPAVHAVPGLIAHRLVERNAAVGDLRVTRKDFPAWWFIIANHRLTWELVRHGAIPRPQRS